MTEEHDLKEKFKAIKAKQKEEAELAAIYEQGQQAAWGNHSVDSCPKYRKQNKIAAWLKGHADAAQERQRQEESRQADKAGLAKLKAMVKQALQD